MEFKELVYTTLGAPTNGVPCAQDEPKRMEALFESLTASFQKRGAEMTPLLGLRTADVVSAWLAVAKLEERLRQGGDASSNETPAKAWDRLRKAIKDLEEMVPEKSPVQAMTLPDLVAPLFEKAEGVLEDALAFEERKKRRRLSSQAKARLNGIKKPDEPTAAICEG